MRLCKWMIAGGYSLRRALPGVALILLFPLTTLLTGCVTDSVVSDAAIHFPSSAPILTVAQADSVLEDVTLANAQIDWRYHQLEQVCYTQFFVNRCLLNAKNQRRVDLALVKNREVAANYFKRKTNVEEMDKALEERNADHTQVEVSPKNTLDQPAIN